MLKYHEKDPDLELKKFVSGYGINHSGSTTLPKWP